MQIGLYLSWETDHPPALTGRIENALAEVRLAESLGFDSVLIAEPPLTCQAYVPPASTIVADYLQRTAALHIGTADRVIALEDPRSVAREWLELDRQSNGRLIGGIAVGEDEEVFYQHDIPFEQCVARFNASLDTVRSALADTSTDAGDAQTGATTDSAERGSPDTEVALHESLSPPLWILARDFTTVSTAVKHGCPILPYPLSERQVIVELYEEYDRLCTNKAIDQTSRTRPLVRDVFVMPSTEQARLVALPHFQTLYRRHAGCCEILDYRNQPKLPEDVTEDNLCEHHLIVGDPNAVTEQLQGIIDDTRANYLLCRMAVAGIPQAAVLDSIRLFAQQIAPQLDPSGLEPGSVSA